MTGKRTLKVLHIHSLLLLLAITVATLWLSSCASYVVESEWSQGDDYARTRGSATALGSKIDIEALQSAVKGDAKGNWEMFSGSEGAKLDSESSFNAFLKAISDAYKQGRTDAVTPR